MPSDQEIHFHRSFLSLKMASAIWNEDYTNQGNRGGPPDRQKRIEADPVYAYHVQQGPHYPAKPPGDGPDKKYNAYVSRPDGSFEPLVIITKRGMSGQNFLSTATPWEIENSVLCGSGRKFSPVVNSMLELTGHYGRVLQEQVIYSAGIDFSKPEDFMAHNVPLYLWIKEYYKDDTFAGNLPPPEGWVSFKSYFNGGIDILALPNGEVIGAKGIPFQSNNGTTYSVMSPLDFWTPGSRLLAAGIRALTNRMSAAAIRGMRMLTTPSAELAVLSAARLSKTLPGVAVSGRGVLPLEHLGRRTIIMGEDLPQFRPLLAKSKPQSGFYDIVIHGDSNSFQILMKYNGKEVWRNVSVREVADAVGARLAPGDKIRLLACDVGNTGGPAQQLANELDRTVWAATTKVPAVPKGVGAQKSFVPLDGGKFYEFIPERGAVKLSGAGGKVTGNEVQGVITPRGKP
jgi:hypothetical protein